MYEIKDFGELKNLSEEELQSPTTIITTSISKTEVETKNFDNINIFFEIVKKFGDKVKNKVIITFSGYEKDLREIYEIPEVREYVRLLFERHPYLFYFLSPIDINNKIFYACLSDIEVISIGEKKSLIRHAKEQTICESFLSYKYQEDLVQKIKKGIEDFTKTIHDVKTNSQEIIDLIFNTHIGNILFPFERYINLENAYVVFLQEFWKNFCKHYEVQQVFDFILAKKILRIIDVYFLLTKNTPYADSTVLPYMHGKKTTNIFIIKDYWECPKCKNSVLIFIKGVRDNMLIDDWGDILVPDIKFYIDKELPVISEPLKYFSIPYNRKYDDLLCLKCGEKIKIK